MQALLTLNSCPMFTFNERWVPHEEHKKRKH